MNDIPLLGYICIVAVGIITVLMFGGLFSLLRTRPDFSKIKMPKGKSAKEANKLVEVIRDPFGDERRQLDELSHLVEGLKSPPDSGSKTHQDTPPR